MNHSNREQEQKRYLMAQIKRNSDIITSLLQQNMELKKQLERLSAGDPNAGNLLTTFPKRVIRPVSQIFGQYPIAALCTSNETAKNIAYELELQDMLLWMAETFDFYGSISVTLHKEILILTISILEALLIESARTFHCFNEDSDSNSRKNTKSKVCASRLHEKGILSQDSLDTYRRYYRMRNRVHIHASGENEIKANNFTPDMTMKGMQLFDQIMDELRAALKRQKQIQQALPK